MEQVAISRRQQVPHEDDGRADRDQDEELTGPTLVHVLSTLEEENTCRKTTHTRRQNSDIPEPQLLLTLTNHTGTKAT